MKAFFCHRSGCSRSFTNPYNLKRHTLVKHLMTTAFTCSICNKRLSSKQSLVEHTTLHTGEMPFKCGSCGAQFRFSSQASKHNQTHRVAERNKTFLELKVIYMKLTGLLTALTLRKFENLDRMDPASPADAEN